MRVPRQIPFMAIALNPIFPVVSSKPVSSEIVLQPGAVIDAQVLKVLDNNFVRIAIANLAIDVLSEVPLKTGQALQLAVSQTPQGIRLAVVRQGGGAPTTALDEAAATGAARPVVAAANTPVLNDAQALAVSAAVQTAAARQSGLSQLFANLSAALGTDVLPPQVRQAVAQLFALQPELTENLTGSKIQAAFETSGLFREKTLASAATQAQPQTAAAPDLKSALIVLRQTLSIALNAANATPGAPTTIVAQPNAAQSKTAQAATPPAGALPQAAQAALTGLSAAPVGLQQSSPTAASLPQPVPVAAAPPLAPEQDAPDILLPPLGSAAQAAVLTNVTRASPAIPIGTDAFLSLIQNALQIGRAEAGSPPGHTPAQPEPDIDPGTARTNVPPPPFRGATPSAQAVAVATIAPDAPASTTVRHLIEDTDGAIARQTLLQVASLPDRVDVQQPGARADQTLPRWSFEIPFVTPQGAAVAQFEVARDGGNGSETEATKKVWRARFSLDVEPAGPVHAIISLAGETTSVRMWAERPLTAAQLRANTAQLAHALRVAALEPGDIVIGEGEPPRSATAPAGHFVNRAS